MCRLLARIGIEPGDIDYYFSEVDRPFKSFSKEHGHGWGIGWYESDTPLIYKEGLIEKGNSDNFEFERVKDINSKIIIIHLRKTKSEEKYAKNAQPFKYKNWIFVHNGGVNKNEVYKILNDKFKKSITSGSGIDTYTDSELYFLIIMQEYEREGNIIDAIRRSIKKVKRFGNYTGLNFIMSDGKSLYVFRDAGCKQDYYSLFYLKRDTNDIVICSEKLTFREGWRSIELGTFIKISPDLDVKFETL